MKIWEIRSWNGKIEIKEHEVIKETDKTIIFKHNWESTLRKQELNCTNRYGVLFTIDKQEGLEAFKTQLKHEIFLQKEKIRETEGLIAEIERELEAN